MKKLEKMNQQKRQSMLDAPCDVVYLFVCVLGGHVGGKHLVEKLDSAYILGIYCLLASFNTHFWLYTMLICKAIVY